MLKIEGICIEFTSCASDQAGRDYDSMIQGECDATPGAFILHPDATP